MQITPNGGRRKPALGTRINPAHPLSSGLVGLWLLNEGAGTVLRDSVLSAQPNPLTRLTQFGWTAGMDGPILVSGSASGGARLTGISSALKIATNLTILARFMPTGTVGNDVFGVSYSSANSAPYTAFSLGVDVSGNVKTQWNNGSFQSLVTATPYSQGVVNTVAMTLGGGTVRLYHQGKLLAQTSTNVGTIIFGASPILSMATSPFDGTASNVNAAMGAIWNRCLSDAEIAAVTAAPYAMLTREPDYRFYSVPGPAGTAWSRTGADTLTLTDAQIRYSGFARTAADTLTLTDTAARAALFARALAESLTATDTASRFGDFARAATETLTASDTLSRNAAYLRTVAESLTLSDAEARSAALVRTAAEALTLSELLLTDLIGPGGSLFARSFDETLTLTEARAAVWSFTRRGAESLTITDALTARQRAILRQFTETITAADVSSASLAGVLTAYFTETLNLSDALSRRLASAISGAAVLRVKGAAASHSPTGQPKTAQTKTSGITGRPGPN